MKISGEATCCNMLIEHNIFMHPGIKITVTPF